MAGETVGAYVRGEALRQLEGVPGDRLVEQLSQALLSEDFQTRKHPKISQKVKEVVDLGSDDPDSPLVQNERYVRSLLAKLGTDPDKWEPLLAKTVDLSSVDFDTSDEVQEIIRLSSGALSLANRFKRALTERNVQGGADGGLYSPNMMAYMAEVHTKESKLLAGIDFEKQEVHETKRRLHQMTVLTLTDGQGRERQQILQKLLASAGTRVHDYTGALPSAMQKVISPVEGRMAALSAEESAGATLRGNPEGGDSDALVNAMRVGIRLVVKEDGNLVERQIFPGVKEALNAETGYIGQRLTGGDKRFLKEFGTVISTLYPDYNDLLNKKSRGESLTTDEERLLKRFNDHPVYISGQEYTLSNGTRVAPGQPIFSFMLSDETKRNLLTDVSRKPLLTTDYPRVDEHGNPIVRTEPPIPQRLNVGEKVRTMNPTDYAHDAGMEWVEVWLRDQGIDIHSIVGADILFPDMLLHNFGNDPKKLGLHSDYGTLANQDIEITGSDGTKIALKMHEHFAQIPESERGYQLAVSLFAVRLGLFFKLSHGIKTISQLLARENPTLIDGGELLSQGDVYSQKGFEYQRLYRIGEVYSQILGTNYFPSLLGRKYKYWYVYQAAQGKAGYRYKRYDDEGIKVLNSEPKKFRDINDQEVTLEPHTLGWINWSQNSSVASWQKAIDEHVFFAHKRYRLDETDQRNAMGIVETTRNGMKLLGGPLSERQKKVDEVMQDIIGVTWRTDVADIIESRFSYAVEPRTRRESWEMVRNMPEWAREMLVGSDHKPYLVSIGLSPDLDPIEYEGILGLEAKVNEQGLDKFDWSKDRTLFMKQAKYEQAAEAGYKLLSGPLRKAFIQAKDPAILKMFGFGVRAQDYDDIETQTVGGLLGLISPSLQLDKSITQGFGEELVKVLAEIHSTNSYMGDTAREMMQDIITVVESAVDKNFEYTKLELERRRRKIIREDGQTITEHEIQEATAPGVGVKNITLKYAENDNPALDWADRIAANYARAAGLRVFHPYNTFNEYELKNNPGTIDPTKKLYYGKNSVIKLPVVISGDGRLLDRNPAETGPTPSNFVWNPTDETAGDFLGETYGHHKLALIGTRAVTLHFIKTMMQDAGVLTVFDNIGITDEMKQEFNRIMEDYQRWERDTLEDLKNARS